MDDYDSAVGVVFNFIIWENLPPLSWSSYPWKRDFYLTDINASNLKKILRILLLFQEKLLFIIILFNDNKYNLVNDLLIIKIL